MHFWNKLDLFSEYYIGSNRLNAKEPNPDIHRKFISKNHKKNSDHVFYDWPSLFVHHWTKPIIQIEIGANKALSAIRI